VVGGDAGAARGGLEQHLRIRVGRRDFVVRQACTMRRPVTGTACSGPHPNETVTNVPERVDSGAKEILVGQKPHLRCAREDLLGTEHVPRIGETSDDIVVANSQAIGENVGFAPPVGQQADYEFDRQPRAAYDGLPANTFGSSVMRAWSAAMD